jgi:hypothetical protein
MDHSLKNTNANFGCAEHLAQHLFPRPARAIAATVKVESGGAEFGIGVTRQMGFREESESADASGFRKLRPRDLSDHAEAQIAYDTIENCAQTFEIGKRACVATACINEPFSAESHVSRATVYPKRIVLTGLQNEHDWFFTQVNKTSSLVR